MSTADLIRLRQAELVLDLLRQAREEADRLGSDGASTVVAIRTAERRIQRLT